MAPPFGTANIYRKSVNAKNFVKKFNNFILTFLLIFLSKIYLVLKLDKFAVNFCCYIIYSRKINKYYIGYTSDIENRLVSHREGGFGRKSYTNRAKDWEIFIIINCKSIENSIELEKFIKSKKSRKYIENLKKYPELLEKITKDFI